MLSIDSMSSMMIPVSFHRAPDGTAKIWLIRSERDYYWLPLNTVSTMLRGVDKGESRWATRIFHSRQTPANAEVNKIFARRKFDLSPASKYLAHPPPNLRPSKETGPPVFIRRRKLTLPKYVTGRVEIPIRLYPIHGEEIRGCSPRLNYDRNIRQGYIFHFFQFENTLHEFKLRYRVEENWSKTLERV